MGAPGRPREKNIDVWKMLIKKREHSLVWEASVCPGSLKPRCCLA